MNDRTHAQMSTIQHVRDLAAMLHGQRDFTDVEMDSFELVEDILVIIHNKVNPKIALIAWLRKHYDVQQDQDNDGQSIVFLDNL